MPSAPVGYRAARHPFTPPLERTPPVPTTGAVSAGDRTHHDGHHRRHPAQLYCLVAGAILTLLGLLGWIADSSFDTEVANPDTDAAGNADGQLQGDGILGFEVNGWHNLVHLLSGVLLLVAARRGGLARTVALAFGAVYGLVALIGLIDGNDILGFIPINAADNILHLGLSALGIVAGLLPWQRERTTTTTSAARPATTRPRVDVTDHDHDHDRVGDHDRVSADERFTRGDGHTLRPEDHRVGGGEVVDRDVRRTDRL